MPALPFLARHWRWIGGGIALLALIVAIALHLRSDNRTRDALATLQGETQKVVVALRTASDNPDADWKTAPGQIVALGESNKALKLQIGIQNERIDEMAAEAVRLQAKAEELRAIADKAQAQRRAAYAKLSDMAITPGERQDCMLLLREAEDALNTVRGAGL